jgi:L-amino acid N-acyltransferase YncA
MIRHATPADGASCAEIYLPSVRDGVASLEDVPPGAGEMAQRIEAISQTHPWLVDERDGELAGYAYASRHHNRSAYRWATDVTAYVSERHQRRGVARGLYERLFELVRAQGFTMACAGITLPNEASVGLHEAFGFEPVGVYRKVAWKLGEWRDVGWWQLELLPMGDGRPAEPRGPQR